MGGDSHGWVRGRCLGRGSTAAVYLATSTSGERQGFFAVKSAELSRSAPLHREEKILSSLCSSHVVSCFGSDVAAEPDGRVLFNLFMEYVPGSDLSDVIKQHGSLDEHTIRVYTRGILDGLAYLHSRGIVHCDVKGHNILVCEDSMTVKLADLGCARWVNGREDCAVISGTPLYMAPEVARGEEQGSAADIWALGCTVIEMATGCPPWRDFADQVAAIHRIAFSPDVPGFPCNISDDARDFLSRCLNRDPRKRWSAEDLLDHPFIKRSEEFPMDCISDSKRNSPQSTLDQGFWDSWQVEDDEEEEDGAGRRHLDNQPLVSAVERLRQMVGVVSLRPPGANATWEESCWMTIRNSESSESPSGDDEPSTRAGSCWAVPAVDAGGGTESAGYSDDTAVPTEDSLPPNPSLHSVLIDVNTIYSSTVKLVGEEINDLVEAHSFPDHEHDSCCDLLLLQEIKGYSLLYPIVAVSSLLSFLIS